MTPLFALARSARRTSSFLGAGLSLVAAAALASGAAAQSLDLDLWGTNGSVYTMARSGDLLYIGGRFSTVGPCTGGGVPLDPRTGAPRRPFARVNGRVTAVVSDGAGGWFIGGHFSGVEGLPRASLAHVLADGSVADWAPGVAGASRFIRTPDPETRTPGVNALVLVGNTLYVGGFFTTACGEPRGNLAAVDAGTGALLPWDPRADDEVLCLAAKGGIVYVGGFFANVGGAARGSIAALDPGTGAATAWDPNAGTNWWGGTRVRTIVPHGHTVLVGGDFDFIGGQPRNSVAILDAATGKATSWDAGLEPKRRYIAHGSWEWPFVASIAVQGRDVFIGGLFAVAGGCARGTLAALDIGTGVATGFDAAMGWSAVYALATRGNTLYVGGYLYTIGGEIRPNIAALDCGTGHATSWNPRADGVVEAIATDGATVFAGGSFGSLYDWQARNGAACLDLATGAATPWDARLGGFGLSSLGLIGNTVYMVGAFYSAGGQTRGNIAALDATTGAATPWDAGSLDGMTYPTHAVLTTTDSIVYVAGRFDNLGGRRGFAALDPFTGAPTAWDARADENDGSAVLPYGDRVFVGGRFMRIGGAERRSLAALEATTGNALHWNPGPADLFITALAARDSTLYVGGTFLSMSGESRTDLAAVDISTGRALPWNPAPDADYEDLNSVHVNALALSRDHVWAGGKFATIQGQPRPFLAALDPTTGAPTEWQSGATGEVYGLAASGDTVYVGGAFRAMGGFPRGGLAAVIPAPVAGARRAAASPLANADPPAALALSVPSPVRSSATLRFTLPEATPVSLAVYDIQGRRVASLRDREPLAAGAHEVTLRTSGWRPGVYFCRLLAGGRSITRKLVVAE